MCHNPLSRLQCAERPDQSKALPTPVRSARLGSRHNLSQISFSVFLDRALICMAGDDTALRCPSTKEGRDATHLHNHNCTRPLASPRSMAKPCCNSMVKQAAAKALSRLPSLYRLRPRHPLPRPVLQSEVLGLIHLVYPRPRLGPHHRRRQDRVPVLRADR